MSPEKSENDVAELYELVIKAYSLYDDKTTFQRIISSVRTIYKHSKKDLPLNIFIIILAAIVSIPIVGSSNSEKIILTFIDFLIQTQITFIGVSITGFAIMQAFLPISTLKNTLKISDSLISNNSTLKSSIEYITGINVLLISSVFVFKILTLLIQSKDFFSPIPREVESFLVALLVVIVIVAFSESLKLITSFLFNILNIFKIHINTTVREE